MPKSSSAIFLWASPEPAIPWDSEAPKVSKSCAPWGGGGTGPPPWEHVRLQQDMEDSTRNQQPWLTACTYPLAPSSLLIGMQFPSLHPEDSLDPSQETHPIQHGLKFKHIKDTPQVKYELCAVQNSSRFKHVFWHSPEPESWCSEFKSSCWKMSYSTKPGDC